MKYLNFFNDKKALAYVTGSPIEDIERLEQELGVRIPEALREYLELMGVKPIDKEHNEHGTNDIKTLYEWIYEDVDEYRGKGYELNEISIILPFERFMDTYFFVPVEDGNENPPVMALDINLMPTVRKVSETVTDFVKPQYEALLKQLYSPKK